MRSSNEAELVELERHDDSGDGGAGQDGTAATDGALPGHLTLKVDSVKHLFGMLSAIYNGKKDAYAVIDASTKGAQCSRPIVHTRYWTVHCVASADNGMAQPFYDCFIASSVLKK